MKVSLRKIPIELNLLWHATYFEHLIVSIFIGIIIIKKRIGSKLIVTSKKF